MTTSDEYTIVGLPYYNKGKVQSFLADLEENRWDVILCHDVAFELDQHCIAAIVNGKIVGHIGNNQADDFWLKLEAMAEADNVHIDEKMVFAELVSVNRRDGITEKCAFVVRPLFDEIDYTAYQIEDIWKDWGKDLLPMPKSQHDVELGCVGQMLKRIMGGYKSSDERFVVKQLEVFRNMCIHDIDRETRQLITDLIDWLMMQESEQLKQLGHEFERLPSSLNMRERIDDRVQLWWPNLLSSAESKSHWKRYLKSKGIVGLPDEEKMKAMLQEMLNHLLSLPGNLPDQLDDIERFLIALFYSKAPREKLSRLYGCFVVCHQLHLQLTQESGSLFPLLGFVCQPKAEMRDSASNIRIADKKLSSVLMVLNAMYKARYFVGLDGSDLTNRDDTLNEIIEHSLNTHCDHISQLLKPSNSKDPEKMKNLLKELLDGI